MLNFTSGDFRVDAIIKFSITTLFSFLLFSSESTLKYQIFSDLRDFFFRIHLFVLQLITLIQQFTVFLVYRLMSTFYFCGHKKQLNEKKLHKPSISNFFSFYD